MTQNVPNPLMTIEFAEDGRIVGSVTDPITRELVFDELTVLPEDFKMSDVLLIEVQISYRIADPRWPEGEKDIRMVRCCRVIGGRCLQCP